MPDSFSKHFVFFYFTIYKKKSAFCCDKQPLFGDEFVISGGEVGEIDFFFANL